MRRLRFKLAGHLLGFAVDVMPRGAIRTSFMLAVVEWGHAWQTEEATR